MKLLLASAAISLLAFAADARAQCTARPDNASGAGDYSYGTAQVKSYTTAKARVFYATSGPHAPDLTTTRSDGVPDTVAFAGDTAQDALDRYAQMGFRKPVSDAACAPGGAATTDIYLVKFAGADGTTVRDGCQGHVCASWILCEATFAGRAYANPQEGFKTVVTHELFHVVQNAYDADMDRFWAEGTAQWAMKTLHPELKDLERNLPAFFSDSARSIDVPPAGAATSYLYGAAIWPVYLTTRQGDGIIKEVLDAQATGQGSLAAVDAALGAHGSSLAEEFPQFVAWNACTSARAGSGGYPNASAYPAIPKPGELDGSANDITSGLSNFTYHVSADSTSQVSLDSDLARNGGVLVPLDGGKCQVDKLAKLPATFDSEAIVVVSGVTTKKTDAPFTLTVGPPTTAPDGGTGGGGLVKSGCAAGGAPPSGAGALFVLAVLFVRRRRS